MDIGSEMRVIDVEEPAMEPVEVGITAGTERAPDPADTYPKPI
jgi:hypothetical protein